MTWHKIIFGDCRNMSEIPNGFGLEVAPHIYCNNGGRVLADPHSSNGINIYNDWVDPIQIRKPML